MSDEKIRLPVPVNKLLEQLNSYGYEAFAVGGCVRDSLLGLLPGDWDITTSALPEQTKACFAGYHVLDTGIRHGTVTVRLDGQPYEVTTFRVDGEYSDHRRPDSVTFSTSLQADLSRRDFTVNAMAYHPKSGLVDLFGGRDDLNRRLIRCVGNSDRRFQEDALRILRAIRFSSVLGFSIEEKTAASIRNNRSLLGSIAAERVSVELIKLLTGVNAASVLLEYGEVLGAVIPEILPCIGMDQVNPYHCYSVWEHIARSVAAALPEPVLRLAMLLHDLGKPGCFTVDDDGIGHFYDHARLSAGLAGDILHRLKFDRKIRETVTELVRLHGTPLIPETKPLKRLLSRQGEERVRQLIQVRRADILAQADAVRDGLLDELERAEACLNKIAAENQCFSLKDLAVGGRDLIAAGITDGRQIGALLRLLLEEVVEDRLANDKSVLVDRAVILNETGSFT